MAEAAAWASPYRGDGLGGSGDAEEYCLGLEA